MSNKGGSGVLLMFFDVLFFCTRELLLQHPRAYNGGWVIPAIETGATGWGRAAAARGARRRRAEAVSGGRRRGVRQKRGAGRRGRAGRLPTAIPGRCTASAARHTSCPLEHGSPVPPPAAPRRRNPCPRASVSGGTSPSHAAPCPTAPPGGGESPRRPRRPRADRNARAAGGGTPRPPLPYPPPSLPGRQTTWCSASKETALSETQHSIPASKRGIPVSGAPTTAATSESVQCGRRRKEGERHGGRPLGELRTIRFASPPTGRHPPPPTPSHAAPPP